MRPTALGLIWVALAVVVLTSGADDVAVLREQVGRAGPAGPLLFAALYAVITLSPLPKHALSAAAGLLFGFPTALATAWAGAVLGAVAAFWLARTLGRASVQRLTGPRLRRADEVLGRRGLVGVLVARLIPVVPFTLVNYGSGLSAVRFPAYLGATAVGILPGTAAYVALGAYGTTPLSTPVLLAVAALVGLTAAGALAARRIRRAGRTG
ncbi:MAG: VTT domain-containing protein [Sporichthyaceae bacterium]